MLKNDEVFLLEVNPRMGGSAYHSHLLGDNIIALYFQMMLSDKYDTSNVFQLPKSVSSVARFFTDVIY